jgi:hypothetical protein
MTLTQELNREAASITDYAREMRSGELSRLQAAKTLDEIARAATRIVQIAQR